VKKQNITYIVFSIFALILVFAPSVFAATTSTVTATVTAQNVSVSVSDGTISYGTLATDANNDTTTSGLNDSQTATNGGNINVDFNILGQDSAIWTLGGTTGVDIYTHKFCTTDCDSSPSWTALTTSYQTLSSSVSESGTQDFDLQIGTPTSTTEYTEQSVDVTVQAVAS